MENKIESIKHPQDTRSHIPSIQEAGYEDASDKVQTGKKTLEIPQNPIVKRGQDPELWWLNKYHNDDRQNLLRVDIRSLYRHEHIAPEMLIKSLYKTTQQNQQQNLFAIDQLFGNTIEKDELEKISEYYNHQNGWTNRLIQGDSLLVMASLLECEGMAQKVQCIYIDPPYGIKYGGNWQVKMNNRDVKDGSDDALSAEPEQIKAFRDTWELGIHSYLSYLRDRLLIAKDLLTDSGSCFVQISDENVHLVRNVMDEVFGSGNFVSQIVFRKTMPLGSKGLPGIYDIVLWYAKDKNQYKFRKLYIKKQVESSYYDFALLPSGEIQRIASIDSQNIPKDWKIFSSDKLTSSGYTPSCMYDIEYNEVVYKCNGKSWRTNKAGMDRLLKLGRVKPFGNSLRFLNFFEDFPVTEVNNFWVDTFGASDIQYVVQTDIKPIQRCILMSTDPGDLVLDPTCGSGTTAYAAEHWGRRWITIDTSRIALNIAKQRLSTAVYPYYLLYDSQEGQAFLQKKNPVSSYTTSGNYNNDIRQGFIYKTVPHITLKSLANEEPPATETLYDQPEPDKKKMCVSGPFTVETLQNFEPISAYSEVWTDKTQDNSQFEEIVKQHLLGAGIKNGRKNEMVTFVRIELLNDVNHLHAEGFYRTEKGEQKAYFHIGPKFGTVSSKLVNEAIKACRAKGDADWLVILGFSFESGISGSTQTTSMGSFEVTKARIHDDLLQEGLKKKPAKSAASFVTIGEPDLALIESGEWLVDTQQKILCNYEVFKKVSGVTSVAEINKLSTANLSQYLVIARQRTVWLKEKVQHLQDKPSVLGSTDYFFSDFDDFEQTINQLGLSETTNLQTAINQLMADSKITKLANDLVQNYSLGTSEDVWQLVKFAQITVLGLDIYDPIRDEVKARNLSDIAYWMIDDDYDSSNFVVKQVFFCGGDKSEFDKWRKGLDSLAKDNTRKNAEKTLKILIDDEAFDRLYGHVSHPIEIKAKGQNIAVRLVSQFGEEMTSVIVV